MEQLTWWERLKTNLRLSYRMAINWWLVAVGAAWEFYQLADDETRLSVLSVLPVDTAWLPRIVVWVGIIVRIWPQVRLQWETQRALAEQEAKKP